MLGEKGSLPVRWLDRSFEARIILAEKRIASSSGQGEIPDRR
jgi:hypothetical protein